MSNIDDKAAEAKEGEGIKMSDSNEGNNDELVNVDAAADSYSDQNAGEHVNQDSNVNVGDESQQTIDVGSDGSSIDMNKYDQVPYESFPYAQTRPEVLHTVGKVFGMNVADVKTASVLELGCACGGNIIPMAANNPEGKYVGIDLSKVQIDEANRQKEALKLENLEFKQMSILDVTKDLGEFDYIVVHGILSWVPNEVQDKIFEICNNNLSENGVALVSYNTLPGWSMIQSIRDMMLFHTSSFDSPEIKAQQARLLLEFIKEGNEAAPDSAYSKMIDTEINTLNQVGNSYLMHDHLEDVNVPFYLHQVMKKANDNGLQYLGDSAIATMFVGNMPQKIAEKLYSVANDIVRTEQYMDFINNRRFRSTLLCKQSVQLNRNLSADILNGLLIRGTLGPSQKLESEDMMSDKSVEFLTARGVKFSSNNPAIKSMLMTLVENSLHYISMDDIVQKTSEKLGDKAPAADELKAVLSDTILRLILAGTIEISAYDYQQSLEVSEKPKISDLARFQATFQPWVTDQRSDKKRVDVFSRVLMQYANGENDKAAMVEKMLEHFDKGDLSINKDGNKVEDKEVIKREVENSVENSLKAFAVHGLLIS